MAAQVTETDRVDHVAAGSDPVVDTTSLPEPVPAAAEGRRRRTASEPEAASSHRGLAAQAGLALLILAALLLGFVGYLLGGSRITASRTQDVMYDELRDALAQGTVPIAAPIEPGTAIGVLRIPALGVQQVVVEGSTSEQTLVGPGRRRDTVLPGQRGSSVLLGRRVTAGAPFRDLDQLHAGDRIVVATGQGEFTYVVDVVRTTDVAVPAVRVVPSRLTLVTSDPAFAPTQQLVVSAVLVGDPAPSTAAATFAGPDEAPGAGSSSAALALALWAQLLLVVAVVATLAWTRYPRVVVWVAAGPIVLAVVWNVYENAAALLSNIL